DGIVLDLEIGHAEPALHRIDDVTAELDGEAHRLLPVVEIGERQRALAKADGEGAAVLDLLQRAFERLRVGRRSTEGETADRCNDARCLAHVVRPPRLLHQYAAPSSVRTSLAVTGRGAVIASLPTSSATKSILPRLNPTSESFCGIGKPRS